MTTEHCATCANSKMRPEDSLMHHDLRFWCMSLLKMGSVRVSGDFSLEQVGIDISAPCTHESNSLDVNTAKNASSRKVEEDKVTQCSGIDSAVFLQCSETDSALFLQCFCYAFGLPALGRTCAIAADYSGHTEFFDRKVSSSYIQGHRDFHHGISTRPAIHARLRWLWPCRPFCGRNIGWWDFSL